MLAAAWGCHKRVRMPALHLGPTTGQLHLMLQIEEASMEQAVRLCGERLGYVHIGESHRWAA